MNNQKGHCRIAAAEEQLRSINKTAKHVGRWLAKLESTRSLALQVGNAGVVSIACSGDLGRYWVRWSLCAPPRFSPDGLRTDVDTFDRAKGLEVAAKTPSVRVGWEHVLSILMAVYHGTHGGEYDHYRAMYQVIRAIGPATMAPDSLLLYLERYAPPAEVEVWART